MIGWWFDSAEHCFRKRRGHLSLTFFLSLPFLLAFLFQPVMVEVSTILGVGGIVVAFGLFLSPLSTIQRIIKGKSTFDFSQLPFLTQLVESSHWALWSTTLSNREEVFITNVLGALFMFTYACIFMFYAQQQPVPQRKALNLQALLAFCLILIALSIFLLVEKSLARTLLVACAVFYNCLKYSSPLSVARLVISTKSVQFMPLPLTLACLLCSLLWGLYGVVLHDIWIIIPNMLGLVCSFAQGKMKAVCSPHDSHDMSTIQQIIVVSLLHSIHVLLMKSGIRI